MAQDKKLELNRRTTVSMADTVVTIIHATLVISFMSLSNVYGFEPLLWVASGIALTQGIDLAKKVYLHGFPPW